MQHKGFVGIIAVLLALVCLFYLSFNIVTSNAEKNAVEMSNGDEVKAAQILDSLSTEKVWFGYTLKECREKELGLGLDLKGGMNVILEVSVPDIVRTLAGNPDNENFNKAMEAAIERQKNSTAGFVDLFAEEFLKLNPGAQLSSIFCTDQLRGKVSPNNTNEEVKAILNTEVQAAVDNSFTVLRTRIDRFGVVQPNMQALQGGNGRILIELPGVKDPERVRKLLEGSASLEFWETYKLPEIYENLVAIENVLKEQNASTDNAEPVKSDVAVADTASVAIADSSKEAMLLATTERDTASLENEDAKMAAEHPLFAKLHLSVAENGQLVPTPAVGFVHVQDTAYVMSVLSDAQLRSKAGVPASLLFRWNVKSDDEKGLYYSIVSLKDENSDGEAPLSGNVITDANDEVDQYSASCKVSMEMNPDGAKEWARLTKKNIGNCIAIVLDGYVYSFPNVNDEITGGRSEISGNFTPEEAKDLANVLKSGKMPAPSHIIQKDVVGPSLGQEAINQGLWSFAIAFVVVMLYMICMYGGVPGLIVDAALLINVFFLFGILASFRAVLTLPGIAGIVLTMGMAVDANVLIYERIKEELRAGKQHKTAVNEGYKNALSAIIDSNVTTLLTGIILFMFGTGPIKGFATTLIIGIITSFFTAVFITRLIWSSMAENGKASKYSFTTFISKGLLENVKVNWIGIRKIGYIVIGVILAVCIASICLRGLNTGIDFSGGRNYVVRFEDKVSTEELQAKISDKLPGSAVSVITIGDENQVRISTNYKIESSEKGVDSEIQDVLYESLKPYINNENVDRDMFVNGYAVDNGKPFVPTSDDVQTYGIKSSQEVGPSIADDIKRDAVLAVIFSLIGIFLYILIRFRNVSYSLGAVVALVHDTLIIIGLYSLLYSIMPFSMEVDQSFIAAILTIIGYSINDTVVVFDRVRELRTLYPTRDAKETINDAVNATLVRTFSTSFSTFIVLLVIFILGGDTIRGFVFALMAGVIAGTISTLFIAVPIAFDASKKKAKKIEEVK